MEQEQRPVRSVFQSLQSAFGLWVLLLTLGMILRLGGIEIELRFFFQLDLIVIFFVLSLALPEKFQSITLLPLSPFVGYLQNQWEARRENRVGRRRVEWEKTLYYELKDFGKVLAQTRPESEEYQELIRGFHALLKEKGHVISEDEVIPLIETAIEMGEEQLLEDELLALDPTLDRSKSVSHWIRTFSALPDIGEEDCRAFAKFLMLKKLLPSNIGMDKAVEWIEGEMDRLVEVQELHKLQREMHKAKLRENSLTREEIMGLPRDRIEYYFGCHFTLQGYQVLQSRAQAENVSDILVEREASRLFLRVIQGPVIGIFERIKEVVQEMHLSNASGGILVADAEVSEATHEYARQRGVEFWDRPRIEAEIYEIPQPRDRFTAAS